jgi:hypothetical protein
MRVQLTLAALLAALGSATVCSGASADMLGGKPINVDGHLYGGNLPAGAANNVEALRVLIKAADAMGQLRDNAYFPASYLVIGDTTNAMRVTASGTVNGQKSNVILDWDYRIPGVRLDVKSPDGKSQAITVASGGQSWDEKTQGIYSGPGATSALERLVIPALLPTEVIQEARDAADVMKLSKDAATGRDVLTIPLSRFGAGVNLVATLDADGHPIHTQIAYNGHTYSADFGEFLGDRMDMMVNFPHHIVLQTDGKETANLEADWHQVGPYLVFVVPSEVAAAK